MKYALINKITTKPNKRDKIVKLLLEISDIITTSNDVLHYVISEDTTSPDVIWIEEMWISKESHAHAHLLPEATLLVQQAMHLIDGLPEQNEVRGVGRKRA